VIALSVRLDVAKVNLMLSSECSQIGTGSSNSPRSATESGSPKSLCSRRRNSPWVLSTIARRGKSTPKEFFTRLIDRFGTRRLMWGSNFPATYDRSLKDQFDLARQELSFLPQ
jgi:hypothetical protein